MFFWHLGATIWIFRYVFRDPGVDLRALTLGALTPNLIDKPLTLLILPGVFDSDRAYGHTLAFAVVTMSVAMVATRRGTVWRKRALAFAVGILIHLLLNGLWTTPELLFWPAFGVEFPGGRPQTLGALAREMFTSPVTIGLEIVGLTYLVWLGWAGRLMEPERRHTLRRSGRLSFD